MKSHLKASHIFGLILMLSLILTSCASKFGVLKVADSSDHVSAQNPLKESEDISPVNSTSSVNKNISKSDLIKSEMDMLSSQLGSYLDHDSPYYIGEEASSYIVNYLFKPEGIMEPIESTQWEKVASILFFFEDENDPVIKMYISDFAFENKLERQYAVSGLMKLLSMRYPLILGGDYESLKKSNEIKDIEELTDTHQILARQAYCLGLADVTVEADKVFRANSFLTRGEAASMLHRILLKLGLPDLDNEIKTAVIDPPAKISEPGIKLDPNDALTVEEIRLEYESYIKALQEPSSPLKQKKLDYLIRSETILEIDFYDDNILVETITIDQWKRIFQEAFGLAEEKIEPYIYDDHNKTVHYDAAAIGIFKLSHLFGGFDARDASEEELETARCCVPQFETAQDQSKLAQMFSSGLLDGLYQIPGFTPMRPLSKAEAILIVKRIVEKLKV